jgi:PilZ domain-containing protein
MSGRPERRRLARIATIGEVSGHVLGTTGNKYPFSAAILDINERGLGVQSPYAESEEALIQCRVKLPNHPVSIPTLAQVRWLKPLDKKFRMGLQFVLD